MYQSVFIHTHTHSVDLSLSLSPHQNICQIGSTGHFSWMTNAPVRHPGFPNAAKSQGRAERVCSCSMRLFLEENRWVSRRKNMDFIRKLRSNQHQPTCFCFSVTNLMDLSEKLWVKWKTMVFFRFTQSSQSIYHDFLPPTVGHHQHTNVVSQIQLANKMTLPA